MRVLTSVVEVRGRSSPCAPPPPGVVAGENTSRVVVLLDEAAIPDTRMPDEWPVSGVSLSYVPKCTFQGRHIYIYRMRFKSFRF